MIGGTYVIGDIHGCYNEWITLKNRIESMDSKAKFILVGDIIDRGPDTIKMIDWAMRHVTENGKYQMIMGNHELERTINWNRYYKPIRSYCKNDMIESKHLVHDSYNFAKVLEQENKTWQYMRDFLDWCEKLPFFKDITINGIRFIIVHANLPYSVIDENTWEIREPKTLREKDFITFDRECGDFDKIPNTMLVHGHNASVFPDSFHYSLDITEEDLGKIIYMENRINLDCGLVYRQYGRPGNLAALRLDDLEEFYLF